MIWFTADHHFGHANIITYCNRPFQDSNEMDQVMVQRWNERIKPGDTVYHLGDLTLFSIDYFHYITDQLNGKIHILPGGHDSRWFSRINLFYGEGYGRREGQGEYLCVEPPFLSLELKKCSLVIVLCHYALRVWDRSHYGSLHLYGHSHGKLPGIGRSMDVGVDTHDFYPYSLDEVLEALLPYK